jgi:hypothetical protein
MTAPTPTYDYVAHPLANMFPMIEGQEFENLKTSIAKSGILEPIRTYQGMILDGRNRYFAGKEVGHKFTAKDFKEWNGTLAEAGALPHEHPKLGVSMNIPMSEEFAARLERAIARASEAYAPKIIEHQPTKVITPAPLSPVPDRRFRRV